MLLEDMEFVFTAVNIAEKKCSENIFIASRMLNGYKKKLARDSKKKPASNPLRLHINSTWNLLVHSKGHCLAWANERVCELGTFIRTTTKKTAHP